MAGKPWYKSGQKPAQGSKSSSAKKPSSSSSSKKHTNSSHGTERKSTRGGNYGR
ncbi:MAG: hypothetical protein NT114_00445 [Patescibacteria group bacterium]|nr:hypothetical protein [Patescibacteria group bacterium]